MDSANSNESLLQVDQSSRLKRKLIFFISLIIIFTFIITANISVFAMLKHSIDSQSLAANPTEAIRTVCCLTPSFNTLVLQNPEVSESDFFTIFKDHDSISELFDPDLCNDSISILHINSPSKTNPLKIFALSLVAAINQLTEITSSTKALQYVPWNCTYAFNNSLSHLTRSLTEIGVDPEENIVKSKKNVLDDTMIWITEAANGLGTCLLDLEGLKEKEFGKRGVNEVKLKVKMARKYVINSLFILENMGNIFNMFYPPIGSVLGSFLMNIDIFFSLGLFCSQLLFVAALFAVLLRLHRR